METLWQDIRYGFRILMRSPGFTAVVVLTLALGIGANTAMFSIVNAVLLQPLPYPKADRLVQLWEIEGREQARQEPVGPVNFADWQERTGTFEHLAAYRYASLTLTGGDESERILGAAVSATFFSVLGVSPVFGRGFRPEEDIHGNHYVTVLGHGFWKRRFGADPNVVGKTITLDGWNYVIVGVMPPGFEFPQSVELWLPLAVDRNRVVRGDHFLLAIGRLKSGVLLTKAQVEMDTIARALENEYPDSNTGRGIALVPLHDQLVGDVKVRLWILLGAVGLVLLVACANVANLLMARAVARSKETSVRLALGASRWRLVRQHLTESILLAGFGGGLGFLLAAWSIKLWDVAGLAHLPCLRDICVDEQTLIFTTTVSLFASLVFGLLPAFHAVRRDLNEVLQEKRRGATPALGGKRLRSACVVTEISLACMLLVGATLLVRSFVRLQQVNPGFQPKNILVTSIVLPPSQYSEPYWQAGFFQQVLQQLQAIPGVRAAGAVNDLPFSGSRGWCSFTIPDRQSEEISQPFQADRRSISSSYFKTMGIPLIQGRDFTDADVKESYGVVIINQTMARRFWPNQNPVGKRLIIGGPLEEAVYGGPVSREIIGLVGDVKHSRLDGVTESEMYIPYQQWPERAMVLVVRGDGDSRQLFPAVRDAIRAVDRNQPVGRGAMMEDLLVRSVARERLNTVVLGAFAAASLIMAVVGIYGIMAHLVAQRTHELGVRIALGAQTRDVLMLILGQGIMLVLLGTSVGLVGALALSRLLKVLLFEISPVDWLTFLAVPMILAITALLASYIPARRAARIDPVVALRYE